jgi:hypothetical protein
MASEQTMSAGTCELDVTCYSPWGGIASGVGMYIFESGGASYQCSGALVNNSNNDSQALLSHRQSLHFHPGHGADGRGVLEVPDCHLQRDAARSIGLPTTLGATYLASAPIPSGDFSLILLASCRTRA